MAPLKDKLKVLTLNAHSLLEWDNTFCLENLTDAIIREDVDVVVMQEVNQTVEAPYAEPDALKADGYVPCDSEAKIRTDNYALSAAKLLKQKGREFSWTWGFAHPAYRHLEEGEAVLSRLPVLQADNVCVSTPAGRCRRVIPGLQVQLADGPVWFRSVHMGWWKDEEDPFAGQWNKLNAHCEGTGRGCLVGDFNSPAHLTGEGYSLITASGWQDAYVMAETKDEGITVGGNIDGWREGKVDAMRIDFVFCREMPAPKSSRVIFNGTFYPVISDHFGVLTEW